MKVVWCWRCQMDIPMLDDDEFKAMIKHGNNSHSDMDSGPKRRRLQRKAMVDYYNQLTGENETNLNVVFHHQISQYGPPCENCGKPYRTDVARFCAGCGNVRGADGKQKVDWWRAK